MSAATDHALEDLGPLTISATYLESILRHMTSWRPSSVYWSALYLLRMMFIPVTERWALALLLFDDA